jgi:predicted RNase H-like HicB family nuclease
MAEPGLAGDQPAVTSLDGTMVTRNRRTSVFYRSGQPHRGYPGYMSVPRTFTAAVHQEEDWYVAQCLEVDVASQGATIDEALANLAEAVELYLEELDDPARYVTSTPLVTSFQLPGAA